MQSCPQRSPTVYLFATVVILGAVSWHYAHAQGLAAGSAEIARTVGTIKGVQADSITLVSDSGREVTAKLAGSTRILRVPPGQKDLNNATPLQVKDLQPGDRVLVRGQTSVDGQSLTALAVIVMKQADVSAKQEHDREDWQRRGVGGLVNGLDSSNGSITITSGGFGASRKVLVHTAPITIVRRYAPESVRFDDAKPASLDEIKPGDQLRARGTRAPDGNELTAEEIVFGTFRNIAGTISAIDEANNSLTVQDAIAKSEVVVRISADSQVKKLPAEMAQRITTRLKAASGEGGNQPGRAEDSRPFSGSATSEAKPPSSPGATSTRAERGNGAPDLQRFLSRIPNSKLSDLQKGDAVMIVSTLGNGSGSVDAITLLAGVEPILAATPNRNASMMLSPWTLGGSSGEAEGP